MEVRAEVSLPCDQARAHTALADLGGYPAWLGIVASAVAAPPDAGDRGSAWLVDIGAHVGPFRRTKRVRMVRVLDRPDGLRFERRELDGLSHSPWELDVSLRGGPGEGTVTFAVVSLHYGGTAWLPLLDAVLAAEVRRAGPRLIALVSA